MGSVILTAEAKQKALELVDQLGALCGNILLNMHQGAQCTPEELTMLSQTLQTLCDGLAQSGEETISALLDCVEDYLTILQPKVLEIQPEDLEALNDTVCLCEKALQENAQLSDEELATACAQLREVFEMKKEGVLALSATSQASFQCEPSQTPLPVAVRPDENEIFTRYQGRAEKLFVARFPPTVFSSEEELLASEAADNLSRMGDLVLARSCAAGSLLLFTAELDPPLLQELLGTEITEVEKTEAPLASLGEPWSALRFSVKETPTTASGTDSSGPDVSADTTAPELHSAAAPAPASSPEVLEDFDTTNLAAAPQDLSEIDPEMLQDFLVNTDELMDKLSESILDLEANPSSSEAIEQIFRTAHTIKGTAGMFGFRAIQRLTHVMENIFDQVRKGQLVVTPAHIDAILFGFDRVRVMFSSLKENKSPESPINDALAILQRSLNPGNSASSIPSPRATVTSADSTPTPQTLRQTPAASPAEAPQPAVASTTKELAANKEGAVPKSENAGTIRVDLKRLDSLVNLVGELVIDRTRFIQIEEELRARNVHSDLLHVLSESVLLFGRHMNEVQSIIMKIRMVPVGNAFQKFTRVVRDVSKECGKEIDLHIEGGEAELDKTLVEEIGDPLVHLIRNSIDHGIEPPEDRLAAGKPRRGTINLRAYQDGNMIVICVQDNGRGLPVEKIRAKALAQGLIKESDTLTKKEIFNLIFEPGFSTAEKITNISGRGVGMDVVKKSIVKLKGVIDLDSEIGQGTTTIIKLPLTLAIIPSLMVETCGESYAIPLVNVIESIRIGPEEIQRIGTTDFVKLRDRPLPLLHLADVFDLHAMKERLWYRTDETASLGRTQRALSSGDSDSPSLTRESVRQRQRKPRIIFVVVGVGEKRVGIVVNQLLGQQEIVIKSLGRILGKPGGIAGGCVLGNGRVALVLDVGEIIDTVSRNKHGGTARV